jgi:glycine betaine/proline transport system substrate-binding protein
MIKNDTYGLGDWEIVESSTSGMLSEVDKAVREGEWVAFTWLGAALDGPEVRHVPPGGP